MKFDARVLKFADHESGVQTGVNRMAYAIWRSYVWKNLKRDLINITFIKYYNNY